MSPNHNTGALMHHLTCIYSRASHYRRQAIVARQRAAEVLDRSLAKICLEEVANHWIALAEQVEWLERSNGRVASSGANGSRGLE
jgi:hypothetical protein